MNSISLIVLCAVCVVAALAQNSDKGAQPGNGSPFDNVVVESTLSVRNRPTPIRQQRDTAALMNQLYRNKRQFGNYGNYGGGFNNQNYGGSSALANAASQGQHFGPQGFGANAANANAQAFQSQGPLGGFGASAANTQTQGFNVGPGGFTGGAGLAGSQSYNLPGGQTVSLSYTNGFSVGPDGRPAISNGNSIAFS